MPDRSGAVDESKRATLRRFAALGAASPLVALASARESSSDVPEAIGGYVAATPGAHFSKIRDDLQLGTGETQHHLRRLEADGAVESWKDGDYRRYVAAGRFDEFEKSALGYLRRETPRGMLLALLREPGMGPAAIAERLSVSRPTVSKYGAQLEEAGLLSRGDGYAVERPETVLVLVVAYADSFGADAVSLSGEAAALVSYRPD